MPKQFFRPYLWLITAVSLLVPRRFRAGWRQEWEAELLHRESLLRQWQRLNLRTSFDLLKRSLGSFWDALWLQPQRLEEEMFQDLRFGLRMLRKNPGFTFVAVITLALGIGANTAIFTVVNAVLLRPLPYPEPERIMAIGRSFAANDVNPTSMPKFVFWREQSQSFEAMAAYRSIGSGVNLAGGNEPEYIPGLRVSVDFFRVLGVGPATGRSFTAEEDSPGGEQVAMLSDGLWRRRFGADAGMIGKTISLNSESYTVIGIMPPDFQFTTAADVIVPLRPVFNGDSGSNYRVLGRLKSGVSREQAAAEMKLILEKFRAAYPKQMLFKDESINVIGYRESLTAKISSLLLILLGAVSFVLLIACANVANLQLTRSAVRGKEIAIRMALGAGWQRIVRQLLTEGLVLSLIGGAAGLLLVLWGIDFLTALIPEGMIPRAKEIRLDAGVFVFTFISAILTGLVFGLAPALQATRVDVNHALKEGGRTGAAVTGRSWLRNALIITEVALSLVLLIGAFLMIRTFANLHQVELGFDPRNILTFQVALSGPKYDTTVETAEFYRRSLERIRSLPGVEAAAVTSSLPLAGYYNLPLEFEGQPDNIASVETRIITPEFFRVLKLRAKQGREFAGTDTESSDGVVIINEAFARQYLSNMDPLRQRLIVARMHGDSRIRQIVGVVNDVKQMSLRTPAPPMIFIPVTQVPDKVMLLTAGTVPVRFAVRTAGEPLSLSTAVQQEMRYIDPLLPVTNIGSMEEILSHSVAHEQFNMSLFGIFAAIGLILAAVGIYGVMAYSVSIRTHEIGVRMALGAGTGDVLRLVLGQGMKLALAGIGLGIIAALALTRVLTTLLYGVSPTDIQTFAGVSLLLMVVALLACIVPARRAMKVEPIVALKYE